MVFKAYFMPLGLSLALAISGCTQSTQSPSSSAYSPSTQQKIGDPPSHDHCSILETPGTSTQKLTTALMRLELDRQNTVTPAAHYYNLGCIYLARGDDDDAFKNFEAAYPSQLSNNDGQYRLGLIYWHRQNYNMAIAYITDAMRGDVTYAPMYDIRGLAYAKNDSIELAQADLAKAVEMEPANATFQADRCRILAKYGAMDEAMPFCDRAIALAPQNSYALATRGYVHLLAGQLEPSIADYTAALQADDLNFQAFYGRGVAYARQGKNDFAAADLAKARLLPGPKIDAFMAEDKVVPPDGM